MSDRDTKLKPCPFCGNEPTIVVRKGKDGWRDRYSILCDYEHGGCGAESGWYHYESEAVEAWNKRVPQRTATMQGMERQEKRKPMTEQEYIQTGNMEQLVHVIHLMTTSCFVCGKDGVDYKRCYFHKKCTGPKEIEEWLKEPHNSFE